MFRKNEDSNSTNNQTPPTTRRAQRDQTTPQSAMENAAAVEEQCREDDRYFNLLYRSYDRDHFGINSRISNLGNTTRLGSNSDSLERARRDSYKAWITSLIDYRRIDAELLSIQRDCEIIENNLARYSMGLDIDDLPVEPNRLSDQLRSIHGPIPLPLTSDDRERGRATSQNLGLSFNDAPIVTPASQLSLRNIHTSTLAEISYSHLLRPAGTLDMMDASSSSDASSSEIIAAASAAASASRPVPGPRPAVASTSTPTPIASSVPDQALGNPNITALGASTPIEPTLTNKEESVPDPDDVSVDVPVPAFAQEPYKCPVCLSYVRHRRPTSTVCGHVFCSGCIRAALRATCKCPVCQRMMSTRQIFRIYI